MSKKPVKDDPELVLMQVVKGMQEKKANEIVSLNLSEIPNAVTRYFVICHAQSKTQVDAIYNSVVEMVQRSCGVKPYHREGLQNSEWILIDYIDVVVHVFLEDIRTFYRLEGLWGDAKLKEYRSGD